MRVVAIHKLQSKNRIEHVCFSLMNDKIQLAKGVVLIIIIYYLLLIIIIIIIPRILLKMILMRCCDGV